MKALLVRGGFCRYAVYFAFFDDRMRFDGSSLSWLSGGVFVDVRLLLCLISRRECPGDAASAVSALRLSVPRISFA